MKDYAEYLKRYFGKAGIFVDGGASTRISLRKNGSGDVYIKEVHESFVILDTEYGIKAIPLNLFSLDIPKE